MSGTRFPVEPAWRRRAKRVPGLQGAARRLWRVRLGRDLRRLHDTLERTPLAGRYWVWSGMLLGWAREGKLLLHDVGDVDFAYRAEDLVAFEAAIPVLAAAGFRLAHVFRDHRGGVAEHRFVRGLTQYDFFAMYPADGRLRYSAFWHDAAAGGDYELVGELTEQPLERFAFVGREWLKPADHEAELEALYGEWRVPDPGWDYADERSIVDRIRLY